VRCHEYAEKEESMAAEILLWTANAAGLIAPAVPWRGELRRLRHIGSSPWSEVRVERR
jgi:hypothetical protein